MLLNDDSESRRVFAVGLVASVVGQTVMGESGEVMVALMILMAVTCTGSAEVIAVTSILVYDIYQIYLKVGHVNYFGPQLITFMNQSLSISVPCIIDVKNIDFQIKKT